MEKVAGDTEEMHICGEYKKYQALYRRRTKKIECFTFYERAKNAYAVVMTGESALYANIILKKGVCWNCTDLTTKK